MGRQWSATSRSMVPLAACRDPGRGPVYVRYQLGGPPRQVSDVILRSRATKDLAVTSEPSATAAGYRCRAVRDSSPEGSE